MLYEQVCNNQRLEDMPANDDDSLHLGYPQTLLETIKERQVSQELQPEEHQGVG